MSKLYAGIDPGATGALAIILSEPETLLNNSGGALYHQSYYKTQEILFWSKQRTHKSEQWQMLLAVSPFRGCGHRASA